MSKGKPRFNPPPQRRSPTPPRTAVAPAVPAALNQALALHQAGRIDEARSAYLAILARTPDEPNALQLLGVIEKQQGRLVEAERLLVRALELLPDQPAILNNLGNTLRELGRLEEARARLTRAVEVQPDYFEAWNNLGNVLKDAGDYAGAAYQYERALALRPNYADALNNLGGVLHKQGELARAADCYRAALEQRPDFAMAHYNLANALTDAGQLNQAIAHFRAAVRLAPDYVEAINGLLRQLQSTCEWNSELPQLIAQLRVLGTRSGKVFPFSFLAIDSTPAEQQECARRWVERQYSAALQYAATHPFTYRQHTEGERLRIGYLSSDFHDHATAWLMAEVFELHDRKRFEVHAYSLGPDDGKAMRQRLRAGIEHFHDIRGLPWAEAARLIHSDGIDILVDLKGYTKDTGTQILAYRPAPVQVNYLGYPGTLGRTPDGRPLADWILTDRHVTPPELLMYYDEQPAWLPDSYQCNDRKRVIGPRPGRAACGLPEQGVVYCCFNHSYKITPEIFGLWCQILAAVPDSVLWLLRSNEWAEANLRHEAQSHGIDVSRLIFAANLPLEQHLGRLCEADLFLDTRPYNAHTSASDALWCGVPVLTWRGESFASRVASSLLHAAGLAELVVDDGAHYKLLAIELGRDAGRLGRLSARLSVRDGLALFDTLNFVAELELRYERMWRCWCFGRVVG